MLNFPTNTFCLYSDCIKSLICLTLALYVYMSHNSFDWFPTSATNVSMLNWSAFIGRCETFNDMENPPIQLYRHL